MFWVKKKKKESIESKLFIMNGLSSWKRKYDEVW